MGGRKPVSKKTRFEVFKRDSFTCQYCGKRAPDVVLQIDHIHPVSKGGDNEIINLVTSCVECNGGKSDRELSDQSALVAQRDQLADLQERRSQLEMMMSWKRGLLDLKEAEVSAADDFWCALTNGYRALKPEGFERLRRLVRKHGLGAVTDAMQVANDRHCVRDENGRVTNESANAAWTYIGRVCNVEKVCAEQPHMRDLFYIRGILKRRVSVRQDGEWKALALLKEAHAAGVNVDTLREMTKTVKSWSEWTANIYDLMSKAGGNADV